MRYKATTNEVRDAMATLASFILNLEDKKNAERDPGREDFEGQSILRELMRFLRENGISLDT